jgi:hypothetical protein
MLLKLFIAVNIIITSAFAQGVNNVWLMGYESVAGLPLGGSRINFFSGVADTSYEFREMNFEQSNASICDILGNLLFYTNGIYVANATGDTMVNGSGLNPSPYTSSWSHDGLKIAQGQIVLPVPDDSMRYYLFHETLDSNGSGDKVLKIFYSTIDMSLDNGRGEVVFKNIIVFQDTLVSSGLTSCKHANGRDWWILCHQYNSDMWFTLLITPAGILGPYTQHMGPVISEEWESQAVFSPDGSKYARNQPNSEIDLFDFDRCTGLLSNPIHIPFLNDTSGGAGIAFSPNSKILYANYDKYLVQFDLLDADIPGSLDTIGVFDYFSDPFPPLYASFYLSLLAPDGKIYINTGNSTRYFHVINSPDSLGTACNFQQHSLRIPTYNAFTIPNYPNYFLGAEGGTVCDSLPTPISRLESLVNSFKIFPNPVGSNEGVTFIYNTLHEPAIISVFNIDGKEVAKYKLPQWSSLQHFRLPALSSGIYLARLTSKSIAENVKFVVE